MTALDDRRAGATIDVDQLRALKSVRRVFGDGQVEVLYVVPLEEADQDGR